MDMCNYSVKIHIVVVDMRNNSKNEKL